jgi:glutathione S-transferase
MARTLYDLAGAEDDRRFSPYCWRVKMALAHKGLSFESVPWRFTEKDAIAFSAQGLVPVLLDHERVVTDSWAILQFLEANYADSAPLAEGAEAWAYALFIKQWTERSLQPAIQRIILPDVLAHLHPKDQSYFRATREARIGTTVEAFSADRSTHLTQLRKVLDPLRATLAERPYLGPRPGLADYLVFGAFQWARCTSQVSLLQADDPVHAWRERMLGLHGGFASRSLGYSTAVPELEHD